MLIAALHHQEFGLRLPYSVARLKMKNGSFIRIEMLVVAFLSCISGGSDRY